MDLGRRCAWFVGFLFLPSLLQVAQNPPWEKRFKNVCIVLVKECLGAMLRSIFEVQRQWLQMAPQYEPKETFISWLGSL